MELSLPVSLTLLWIYMKNKNRSDFFGCKPISAINLVDNCDKDRFLKGIPSAGSIYSPKNPVTKNLKKIIDENFYSGLFEQAIARVSAQGVSELEEITNLYQFYFYVDFLASWIPEIRVWKYDGEFFHERTCYLRITQFYYYFNQEELVCLQSPIAPLKGGVLSPISSWLREFAVEWGGFLDTKESREKLESFKYAPEYSWQDYELEPQDYYTFNDFFARKFKDINKQRPVARSQNDRVIVFPAESTFVGQWSISTGVGDPLPASPSVIVKHISWSIEELLQDSSYKTCFEGGRFSHSFLNTYDYHCMHTPVRGKILEAKFIPGQVYLQVDIESLSEEQRLDENSSLARTLIPRRLLDADDSTGYQFVQCRGLLVLDSPIGKVAILSMGMAQVSSVVFVKKDLSPIKLNNEEKARLNYDQQVEAINQKLQKELVDAEVEFDKGEMFSFFQFGGSDCVMVFERQANICITAQPMVHYPIRSQFAFSNIEELLRVQN